MNDCTANDLGFDFGQIGRINYDPLRRNSDDISQLSDIDRNKRFPKLCHDPSVRDADRRAAPTGPRRRGVEHLPRRTKSITLALLSWQSFAEVRALVELPRVIPSSPSIDTSEVIVSALRQFDTNDCLCH